MRVEWTQKAAFDLFEADLYLRQKNPLKATEMALAISHAEKRLLEHPGIAREGRILGTREYVLKKFPYILVFRIKANGLEVLAFFHASRQPLESGESL